LKEDEDNEVQTTVCFGSRDNNYIYEAGRFRKEDNLEKTQYSYISWF
jgi:hypothetical protein